MPHFPEPRIGVFGHYGNRNLGDEAIVQAVLENIRLRFPGAACLGLSVVPEDTARRHGVVSRHIREAGQPSQPETAPDLGWEPGPTGRSGKGGEGRIPAWKRWPGVGHAWRALARLVRAAGWTRREARHIAQIWDLLKDLDLIIVAGSNQFLDNFGGAGGFPYTLCKWSVLARMRGVPIAFASVGAGPLTGGLSKVLVRMAASLAGYVSYRDEASKALVEAAPWPIDGRVAPDLANSLSWEPRPYGQPEKVVKVAINPMPVYDPRYWHAAEPERYRDYVAKLADFSAALLREGHRVTFFPTQYRDDDVIRDIWEAWPEELRASAPLSEIQSRCRTVNELMEVIDGADMLVPTRFHGSVLSLLQGKPVLAVCYYRKTADLMGHRGQGDFAYPIDAFTADDLLKGFAALRERLPEAAERIASYSREYREALDAQYEEIFRLLERRRR